MKRLTVLAAALTLTACATTYSPDKARVAQANTRSFRVAYPGADEAATGFLIRRACEVALAQGSRYFVMSDIVARGGEVTGFVAVSYYGVTFGGPTRAPVWSTADIDVLDEPSPGCLDACPCMTRSDNKASHMMSPDARVNRMTLCSWRPGKP